MYDVEVPRNYQHAIELDALNGNRLWQEAIDAKLDQIKAFHTVEDIGHKADTQPPEGFTRLHVYFVFDVKCNSRHKARLVTDRHRTPIMDESAYYGVVSPKGFRLVEFLAERNNLELWSTDVINSHLEALTNGKLHVVAEPELDDHCLPGLLSKQRGYTQVWDFLKTLLFWSKDTGAIVPRKGNYTLKGSDKM
jgi:hypothetical protein